MVAQVIDGKAFAAGLRERIAERVAQLKAERGLQPGLAVVLVGDDPGSQIYVRNKGVQTLEAGMHSVTHRLPAETSEAEVLDLVRTLNADPLIHGILVQFPVPPHIRQSAILEVLSPDKDVDGLTVANAGRLASGLPALSPCTPVGCMMLLRDALGELRGKRAVVIGRRTGCPKPRRGWGAVQDPEVQVPSADRCTMAAGSGGDGSGQRSFRGGLYQAGYN